MNYKGLLLLILSISTALAVTWLNNFWLSYQDFVSASNEREIDYYLSDFSLLTTSAKGEMRYYMQGRHLVHKNATGASEIFNPTLQATESDGQTLLIQAKKAQQKKNEGVIELSGSIFIKKTNNKNNLIANNATDFTLKTERLSFNPIKQEIFTDAMITLSTKNAILTGVGLQSKLDQQELRILSNVHAKFDPNP